MLLFALLFAVAEAKKKFLEGFPMFFKFGLFWWCALLAVIIISVIVDFLVTKLVGPQKQRWKFEYVFPPETDLKKLWSLLTQPSEWPPEHPILSHARLLKDTPKMEKDSVLRLYEKLPDVEECDPDEVILEQRFVEYEGMKSFRTETLASTLPYPLLQEESRLELEVGNAKEITLNIVTDVVIASRIYARMQGAAKQHQKSMNDWAQGLHKCL